MLKKVLLPVLLVAIGVIAFSVFRTTKITPQLPFGKNSGGGDGGNIEKRLSNGHCSGEGTGTLSISPMRPEDFASLIPYGLMVGDHVTPIDHQYFTPADYNSPRDSYEVYAMADARITDIQPRVTPRGTEYRFVFSITCTFYYYYDLVTSLAPDIKTLYDKSSRGSIDIPVKAGQVIGKIGGQTLDFAVWNTEKALKGFVNQESYEGEPWKIYTDNPFLYYTPELKELLIEKNIRTAMPIEGKIDYDIDGRLIGNWFLEETNGYSGLGEGKVQNYSKTHLAIAPDHIDPSGTIFSTGDFNGEPKQFGIPRNSPNPKDVGVETGLIKYELTDYDWYKPDGERWDRKSLAKDLKFKEGSTLKGCALVQLIENKKLKVEVFGEASCSQIPGFDSGAKIYER
ncbi:MAG: hypothetical protein AAB875_07150 [Patescibacteria group bacterium]